MHTQHNIFGCFNSFLHTILGNLEALSDYNHNNHLIYIYNRCCSQEKIVFEKELDILTAQFKLFHSLLLETLMVSLNFR